MRTQHQNLWKHPSSDGWLGRREQLFPCECWWKDTVVYTRTAGLFRTYLLFQFLVSAGNCWHLDNLYFSPIFSITFFLERAMFFSLKDIFYSNSTSSAPTTSFDGFIKTNNPEVTFGCVLRYVDGGSFAANIMLIIDGAFHTVFCL